MDNNNVRENREQKAMIEFLDYHQQKGTQSGESSGGLSSQTSAVLKGKSQEMDTSRGSGKGLSDGVLQVQYNPASISFSANTKETTASKQEGDYKVTTISAACTITMKVDLVFHAKEEADKSVKEQMELFFTIMKRNTTRRVRFSWANIAFTGEANSFTGEYNMFDSTGNPISGKISLDIQGIADAKIMEKSYEKMADERSQKIAE